MAEDRVVVAGFGGQGIISLGKILAWIGMKSGRNVTHFPSYGAEMRGGTANCTVVISDEEVATPVFTSPTLAIVMNDPSLMKFGKMVQPGGILVMDSSLVKGSPDRTDIRTIAVPATEEANRLGNLRTANIVMLGVYMRLRSYLDRKLAEDAIAAFFGGKRKGIVEQNLQAFSAGYNAIKD
jgi:2-oxoglutarate ferredoxin oxidoreductase subunit gamma